MDSKWERERVVCMYNCIYIHMHYAIMHVHFSIFLVAIKATKQLHVYWGGNSASRTNTCATSAGLLVDGRWAEILQPGDYPLPRDHLEIYRLFVVTCYAVVWDMPTVVVWYQDDVNEIQWEWICCCCCWWWWWWRVGRSCRPVQEFQILPLSRRLWIFSWWSWFKPLLVIKNTCKVTASSLCNGIYFHWLLYVFGLRGKQGYLNPPFSQAKASSDCLPLSQALDIFRL